MKKLQIFVLMLLALACLSSCTRTKKEYFEDGSLKSAIKYRFGKESGTSQYYFINAPHPLKISVEMKRGKKDGAFVKYFITGRVEIRCTYKDDLLEGLEEVYDIYEHKISETNYLHGKKHGLYTLYHENGEIMEQGEFFEDLFDGKWSYFDERGVLVGEGKYDKGNGVQKGYNKNGNLVRLIHYQNNKKNGQDIEFNDAGDTLKVTLFKDDRIVSVDGEPVENE